MVRSAIMLCGLLDRMADGVVGRQASIFALEFHIPYFALRRHHSRRNDPRSIRKSHKFLHWRDQKNGPSDEFIHEAQISMLVIGTDEWFWTALCCVETFFEDERRVESFVRRERDAPTGGTKRCHFPVWNPRAYFLTAAASRMRQVRQEWENIMTILEESLAGYVSWAAVVDHLKKTLLMMLE